MSGGSRPSPTSGSIPGAFPSRKKLATRAPGSPLIILFCVNHNADKVSFSRHNMHAMAWWGGEAAPPGHCMHVVRISQHSCNLHLFLIPTETSRMSLGYRSKFKG